MLENINPGQIALQYFCLLFSLCVHEAAHAIAANWCGDPTAKMLGRVTLDPRKHIDPIGTVAMPLLAMVTNIPFLIGWAKPVPFILRNLRNVRRDPVIIALAGPASNLLIGILCLPILRLLFIFGDNELMSTVFTIFFYLTLINFALMLFNLLPVPPLDGHYLLRYFLPPRGQEVLDQLGMFGIIIVIFVGGALMRIIMPPVVSAIVFIATGSPIEL